MLIPPQGGTTNIRLFNNESMSAEFINQQDFILLDTNLFTSFTNNIFDLIPEVEAKSVTIAFVTNEKIKEFNKQFRNKDSVTDVLSFPHKAFEFEAEENYLGDIAISVEQAQKQALENDLTLELEIKQLILHGILHLCGYDHETDNGEMNRLELKLREKLGIT